MLLTYILLIFIASHGEALNNGLFLTPPMGWISWLRFKCTTDCEKYPGNCINETLYMQMADRMAEDGWKDAGYEYINVDDCWSEKKRDPKTGKLVADRQRFPSGMKALGDYIHSKGLKFGIYSDTGDYTCGMYPGSRGHYELDAHTFAEWGVDSLKLDGCNTSASEMPALYSQMSSALNKTGRPIGYICSWPAYDVGHVNLSLVKESCNSWRNYWDIQDKLESLNGIIDWFALNQEDLAVVAGSGGWNDADMLDIGNFGLSLSQSRLQMAIWSMISSPLMMGNDLRNIEPKYKDILQNKEIIAVNQDKLGVQGKLVLKQANIETWTKELANGDMAVVLAHRLQSDPYYPTNISINFEVLGWEADSTLVRDLFERKDLGKFTSSFNLGITPEGASMVRLSKVSKVNNTQVDNYTSKHALRNAPEESKETSSIWSTMFTVIILICLLVMIGYYCYGRYFRMGYSSI